MFAKVKRGTYAPVSTNGRDEEAEGLVGGSMDEKRNADRRNLRSLFKPVLQGLGVVTLMVASYAFGAYSTERRSHSVGFIPDSKMLSRSHDRLLLKDCSSFHPR